MLEFRGIEKSFGSEPLFSIASQTLDKGIYWLQGPNGCGKTTLLRTIAGILPVEGDILLQGHSLRNDAVGYRRLVAWADAEPLYPGFLTGEDLLNFYSDILRPEPQLVGNLCERLGVRSWLTSRVAAWSSGMTKKIALLLAFLGRPALIVLDEPLITLDEAAISELIALIREYHERYSTSFLLTSHQPLPVDQLPGTRQLELREHSIHLVV